MSRLTIVVSGMIAADPHHGGATWSVLQYVLGFKRLGHEVYLIEPIPESAVRPAHADVSSSVNARYFDAVVAAFGLEPVSVLLLADTCQTHGLPYQSLVEIAHRADVLINISGMLTDETLLADIPVRVYLDLDPAFNQLWQQVYGIDMRFGPHTHFVTVGQALGTSDCEVPTCGREWTATFQPIVLSR